MKKLYIFISIPVLSLILLSCNNKVIANFEITNETDFSIDSLKIEPMVITDGKYISLNNNETIAYEVDMTGIVKTDGSYKLSYYLNGKTIIKDFGYYTNGYPIENLIEVTVLNDTILFNSKFYNSY